MPPWWKSRRLRPTDSATAPKRWPVQCRSFNCAEKRPAPFSAPGLLPRHPRIGGQRLRVAGAKRVDVQPAPARVAGIHGQLQRFAMRPDVHEDALHALLVKLVVVAVA